HRLDQVGPGRAGGAGRLPGQARPAELERSGAGPAGRSRRGGAMSLDQVREIADAVLYEGYLLYPYRASSGKNQSRWQFGVLGPPQAGPGCFSEEPELAMQCLLRAYSPQATVTVQLRFLQLQAREVQQLDEHGEYRTVPSVADESVLSWDEAVEREFTLLPFRLSELGESMDFPLQVAGGSESEPLDAEHARIRRQRWPLTAGVSVGVELDGGYYRL